MFVAFRDGASRESQIVNDTIIVDVDYSTTFPLSSASLLIIIIIIVVVGLVGYYNWKKKTQEE